MHFIKKNQQGGTMVFYGEKLVEQQKAINAANTEANTSFDQNPIQWKLAENMIKLLQPFEEATEDINSETSSVALVISTVNSPKRLLQVHEEDMVLSQWREKCCCQWKIALGTMKHKKFTAYQ